MAALVSSSRKNVIPAACCSTWRCIAVSYSAAARQQQLCCYLLYICHYLFFSHSCHISGMRLAGVLLLCGAAVCLWARVASPSLGRQAGWTRVLTYSRGDIWWRRATFWRISLVARLQSAVSLRVGIDDVGVGADLYIACSLWTDVTWGRLLRAADVAGGVNGTGRAARRAWRRLATRDGGGITASLCYLLPCCLASAYAPPPAHYLRSASHMRLPLRAPLPRCALRILLPGAALFNFTAALRLCCRPRGAALVLTRAAGNARCDAPPVAAPTTFAWLGGDNRWAAAA